MNAGDLIPGLYWAHDRDMCEIHTVRRDGHEVLIDYTYCNERRDGWYALTKNWSVVPLWQVQPYVINEIGVLV